MVTVAGCTLNLRPVASFDEFADHVRGVLDQAAGADLVVLPELLTFELFSLEDGWETATLADLVNVSRHTGDYLALFAGEASVRGQHIVAGSTPVAEDGTIRNVAHVFGPEGLIVRHAKTHLFPAEHTIGITEGDTVDIVELPFATIAVNICYEMEIPECSATAVAQGADIVVCPSMTFSEAGFWRVRHCAQSRCIENQIYAVHACAGGQPFGPYPGGWAGSSVLSPCDAPWASPKGILAEVPANEEGVAMAALDLKALRQNRLDGAATTFFDRRRRAALYEQWPSHLLSSPSIT